MTYGIRLLAAVGLFVAEVVAELVLIGSAPGAAAILGGALLLAGNSLLLLRGYDLRPARSLRGTSWDRTTLERFREVIDLERRVSRWDETLVDISCLKGFIALLLLGIAPVAIVVYLVWTLPRGRDLAVVVAVDAAVLILPHWLTGIRRKWRPVALSERVQALLSALDALEDRLPEGCRIQPTFRMQGEAGERVPTDARVFLRFPDAPEEFLGVQLQVAVNEVQGTKYPYLYAVIVAEESFGLLDRVAEVEAIAAGLTVETSREDDAHVIVIRQPTTKKTGYHTNRRAVARIVASALQSVGRVTSDRLDAPV